MNASPTMPCPSCGTQIGLDPSILLSGKDIKCPGCGVSIGLEQGSAELARDSLAKMESVRQHIGRS